MATSNEILKAIRAGNIEQLRSLLESEPSLASASDENGVSMLLQAAYHRRFDMVEMLRAKRSSLDVFEAATVGDEESLKNLLEANPALANAKSADGFTPLHLAAFFSQAGCARVLIDHGSDVKAIARNATAVTPLHSAVARRQYEIARLLLEQGALADARQQNGYTALHAAAMHGDERLAGLLLEFGADPALKADDGSDATTMAQKNSHEGLAEKIRGTVKARAKSQSG